MKINLKLFIVAAISSLFITSCDDGDKIIDDILATTERGAILRTVEVFGVDYDRFDTSTSFGFTIEEQDVENGDLLDKVDIFVNFVDNTDYNGTVSPAETLVATLPASAFTVGEFGLPRATFESSFADALSALGVVEGEFDGGDAILFRLLLTLTDGRTFTNSGNTQSLTGFFLSSPFQYNKPIKCIPPSPVPGDYIIDMADSFGDGWDGAFITVNIDGTSTDYTIEDGAAATHTITVPDGTTELVFTYVAGNFEGEHSFVITAPTGELALEDGPGPATGVLVLNICNG
ncbi:hypothetical protein MNBD_BACTEROID03-2182 [hydrothermal vent metagenome]|uniref:Uncharacterized protein n=1 Tax=hydrothermal vent metagenome TaxID=652676 RepID=A0A3B0TP08_9ZZZZ